MKEMVAGAVLFCMYVVMWPLVAWFFLEQVLAMVSALTNVVQSFGDYIVSKT